MKLQDLFEIIDLSKSIPVDYKGRPHIPISGDLVGSGVQANVFHTGQGTVTKIADLGGINDPAVQFLKLILDHQDNPFFPKIYHAKIYKDKNNKNSHLILIVQMEKLTKLDSTKLADVIVPLFNQIGMKPRRKIDLGDTLSFSDLLNLGTEIDSLIDGSLTPKQVNRLLSEIKNPKFREAFDVLSPYMKKYGSDMHSENWMVRLTKTGPQLVIIDPFVS